MQERNALGLDWPVLPLRASLIAYGPCITFLRSINLKKEHPSDGNVVGCLIRKTNECQGEMKGTVATYQMTFPTGIELPHGRVGFSFTRTDVG